MMCICARFSVALRVIEWLWNVVSEKLNAFVCLFVLDLVPREIVEKWLKHLRKEFPAVAFKASTQTQKHNLVRGGW